MCDIKINEQKCSTGRTLETRFSIRIYEDVADRSNILFLPPTEGQQLSLFALLSLFFLFSGFVKSLAMAQNTAVLADLRRAKPVLSYIHANERGQSIVLRIDDGLMVIFYFRMSVKVKRAIAESDCSETGDVG